MALLARRCYGVTKNNTEASAHAFASGPKTGPGARQVGGVVSPNPSWLLPGYNHSRPNPAPSEHRSVSHVGLVGHASYSHPSG